MKKVTYFFVDGDYVTARRARKLHPEGFDTTFRREVEVETFGDRFKSAMKTVAGVVIIAALAVGTFWLATHM